MHADDSSIHIVSTLFANSTADSCGAVSVSNSNISITGSNFTDNKAELDGGAVCLTDSTISIVDSFFIGNVAGFGCGTIYISRGSLSTNSSVYENNEATTGGAICVETGTVSSVNSHYRNNRATSDGGAFHVSSGHAYISDSICVNNTAKVGGGVVYILHGSLFVQSCVFTNNSANTGGVMSIVNIASSESLNSLPNTIGLSNFTNNGASKATVYLKNALLICTKGLLFHSNALGTLYAFNSQLDIIGSVTFDSNRGLYGGAITSDQSQVNFNSSEAITITGNSAKSGGGIALIESTLHSSSPLCLTRNKAVISGGGIFAYQSEIQFESGIIQSAVTISNNLATLNGGGIHAAATSMKILHTFVRLENNVASSNGGAMLLEQSSKVYLYKQTPEIINSDKTFKKLVSLKFINNSASYGGAVYVSDQTDSGVLCQRVNDGNEQIFTLGQCFLQTLQNYESLYPFDEVNFINTFFINNTASDSGTDIYGGLLDRCSIHPLAELTFLLFNYFKISNGFDYFKATVQFEQIVDYHRITNPTALVNTISSINVKDIVTSDPVKVVFCYQNIVNTSYAAYPAIFTKKGERFTVSIVAVDQVGNPVNATVISVFLSDSGIGRFKEGQVEQSTGTQCTDLEYNVYSLDNSAQVQLYAEGPCSDQGYSQLTLNISFLPCVCPIGFQHTISEIECICDCNIDLKRQLESLSCWPNTGTILVESNFWIGYTNKSNTPGFIIQVCPLDYCLQKPANISLASTGDQCDYNRTGVLCGKCQDGLSMVFGSSHCMECSSNFIFLLVAFAIAGILLVAFILLFNFSVATGTIHGLIFYANMMAATSAQFQPSSIPSFLTVFISWLNLDLGIETCFYDGMDSTAKVLLQLVFPMYLFLLMIAIIILCNISKRISTCLGKRNPVAFLCTLIFLSYSKLLRIVIAAFRYSTLVYPDNSNEVVWLYDGNLKYFSSSHIPSFIAAFIILFLGIIYTVLLFFGQWLPRCSNLKLMKWTKNTKYNAFIDAYQAPFVPKHRYWTGLLLFSLITHNLVTALAVDGSTSILSAGIVTLGLLFLKLIKTVIFKIRLCDCLETIFLLNLAVLAMATSTYQSSQEHQYVLVTISMGVSFVLFQCLICFHSYKHILKGTTVWIKLSQTIQQRVRRHRDQQYRLVHLQEEEPLFDQDELDEVGNVMNQELGPAYSGDSVEDYPRDYTPPIIRFAVPDDQLREPDLDILGPVNSDDYRVPPPPPRKPPIVTYSVIDGRPDHRHS